MLLPVLILIICGAILVFSTRILVTQSQNLAFLLGISPLFVALTIVAFGTSLPELVVSYISLRSGDVDLAMANIVGSNITNATLVLGCAITVHQLLINAPRAQINAWFLLLITGIFMAIRFSPLTGTTASTMLISAGIAVTLFGYHETVSEKKPKKKKFSLFADFHLFEHHPDTNLPSTIFKILFSIAAMAISGHFLVSSVGQISVILGISTGFLGLTVTSLVTSLPEILTTIIAQQRNDASTALGNILGSNIYNLAFIGGLLTINNTQASFNLIEVVFLIFSTLFLFSIIKYWQDDHVPKTIGVYAILSYVVYIFTLTLTK